MQQFQGQPQDGSPIIALLFRASTRGQADRNIPGKDVAAAPGEGVGVLLPEDVAHAGAGHNLQPTSALPHAERNL